MVSNSSLLFFDTFSHESTNVEQLDLVQFHQAVQVTEIRVIPLGARVKADFPGGVRLGATNPSQFGIEFFVNDLSRRGAATFENIGNLQYSQHGSIHLGFDRHPPTDGLLLRGSYNTITLAVYGNLTKVHRDPSPKPQARTEVVPQPPPEKVNTHERIRDWLEDTKRKQHAYEINPSEEDPEWESKPKSPAECITKKPWDDTQDALSHERGKEFSKDRRSKSSSRERQKEKLRERDREKSRSMEISPLHEKSPWDRSERSSLSRDAKRETNREEYCMDPDYEMRGREREKDVRDTAKTKEQESERSREWERSKPSKSRDNEIDIFRENRGEQFDEEISGYDIPFSQRPRSIDEWDERRSERSDRSARRPRTPPEPGSAPQDPRTDPRTSSSPFLGNAGVAVTDTHSENIHSPKEYSDRDKRSKERRLHTPENSFKELIKERDHRASEDSIRSSVQILAPIFSEDMEAISDDEEILNLPAENTEGAAEAEFPSEEPLEEEGIEDQQHTEAAEDNEGFEYEQIMSDEEELPEYQYEEDYMVEEWEDWIKPFSPQDLLELPELLQIYPPLTTVYEKELQLWSTQRQKEGDAEDKNAQGAKLSSLVMNTPLPTPSICDPLKDNEMSQDIPEESGELWVKAAEQVGQMLPKALVYVENKEEILGKLFEWVGFGLDFEMATNQQQPVYKIRHMKAGVKLAMSLLQCSSSISISLLGNSILEKLFDLMEKPHMAISIKLLIIRAIDATTITPAGLKYLISEKQIHQKTAYEHILQMLSSLHQTRAKLAFSAIVRKIHLLEVCEKLYSDTGALLGFLNPPVKDQTSQHEPLIKMDPDLPEKGKHQQEEPEGNFPLAWTASIPPSLIQSIVTCLKEIHRYYSFADQLLVQPNRWLPGSKQFQLPKNGYDPYPFIYTIFRMSNFLESLCVLLVTPNIHSNPGLLSLIKSHLVEMTSHEHGLRFIAWERKPSTIIVKSLLQFCDDDRYDDAPETNSLYSLGTRMVYMLQTLHQLDCIAQLGGRWKQSSKNDKDETIPDYSQAVIHFNVLESLLMSPVGRQAVVSVLGMPKFAEIVFPYLALEPNLDAESKGLKVSCFGYAVDLILHTIKFNDSPYFLEQYSSNLSHFLEFQENEEPKIEEFTKFCEILPFINVAKPENFTYENLANLSTIVQDSLEKLEKFPGELYSSLRILVSLTIPKMSVNGDSQAQGQEIIEELKYKYATIQLFSCDLHTHLTNMLTKLCSIYQQPFLYSSNFLGSEGYLVLLLLKPALLLLKNILNSIIQARNTDFKDLTAVAPLVSTYILLRSFPTNSPHFSLVVELQQEIISILLSYTQAVYTTEGEDVLSKSLWTQMMAEIFKQVMASSHMMVGVVTLITELLPLPLPVQTQMALTHEETTQSVNVRKLWSAHLYNLAPTLHEIIQRLGFATHPYLTHSLRRMCVALSDLSAPMALLVARSTLDLLLQTHRLDQRSSKDDVIVPCSPQTSRILNMLASLVSHAPTKAACLHLLKGGSAALSFAQHKAEEKYSFLLGTWCKILTTFNTIQAHCQAQECLLTIIHYLFDYENSMQVFQGDSSHSPELGVLTGIPHKDLLVPILEALFEVLRLSTSLLLIRQTIRVMISLLDHNYGFFFVKSLLDKKKDILQNPLISISKNFQKDNETIGLLQDLLEFFKLLTTLEENSLRTHIVTPYELSVYLGWKSSTVSDSTAPQSLPYAQIAVEKKEPELKIKEELMEEGEKTEEVDGKAIPMEVDESQPKLELTEKVKDEPRNDKDRSKKEGDPIQEKNHPLRLLEQLVVSDGEEEEVLEYLYEDISQINSLLEKACLIPETTSLEEPPPLGLDSLQTLFANRVVWTLPQSHDDLHSFWMSSPSFDEIEEEHVVKANLLETCRKYAGNYDLLSTLHKLIKGQSSQSISPQKHAKNAPKYKQSVAAIRPDRRSRPYVAPMRGRNFGRGMNIRSDPFRSRPPNTSRPPSLHVDDFVALEITGHQPTGPTGYNKISFGRGKMMLDSLKGRGRPRGGGGGSGGAGGGDNRGRFFHRPSFRGDGPRGMNRGGMRGRPPPGWVFRGDPRGNFRGPMNPCPPMRFMRGRGGPFMRGGMPGGAKDRLANLKFIDRGRRDGGRHLRGGFR